MLRTKEQCGGVLYAHPHGGVTDIYKDKEKKNFYCRDPWHQYRKSKARIFNCFWYWVQIIQEPPCSP